MPAPRNAIGEVRFRYTGDGGVGTDIIHASGTFNSEPFFCVAEAEWVASTFACTLTPENATAIVGTTGKVTATVTTSGQPQQGVTVDFIVFNGPNAGDNGTGTSPTDANGNAEFDYPGDGGTGTDLLQATGSFNNMPFGCTTEINWFAQGLIFRVERSTGDVFADGAFIPGGADLAERIDVSEPVEPGDVVELDPTNPGHYRKARGNSQLIAGVITTEPGFVLGNSNQLLVVSGQLLENEKDERPMLALLGRVPVKTTTKNGPIRPGDLLTVSSKPGYAMLCPQAKGCEGAMIGKALESLASGEGMILVLVMGH